jgi:hypothetical protein
MNENRISSLMNTIEMIINNKVETEKNISGLQGCILKFSGEKIKKVPSK